MSTSKTLQALCLVAAGLAGCAQPLAGGSGNKDGGQGPGALTGLIGITLTPADASLVIDGATAAVQTYRAVGRFADGHTDDITALVTFSTRDVALGTFSQSTFTSTTSRGGLAGIVAVGGGLSGMTSLALKLRQEEIDPASTTVPKDPGARFGGALDPARSPLLVYPNDGVLIPPNLRELEVHFLPGAGNTLFQLSFRNTLTDLTVYLDCSRPMNGGCIYPISRRVWQWIAETNRGGHALEVAVKATDAEGRSHGLSKSLTFSITLDEIQGGIYYWTTSTPPAIMRFDFASTANVAPEKVVGRESAGGNCIGCHALSHSGTKLLAAGGTPARGQLLLLDVGRAAPLVPFGSTMGRSLFEAWNPDDSRFVGVFGELDARDFNLLLFDGATAAPVGRIEVNATAERPATHPDWSPDGQKIAYTHAGEVQARRVQEVFLGGIEMVTGNNGTWSAPTVVVPSQAGRNHYYPAFAPDSSFIVYDESMCTNGVLDVECDADSDPTARLWAVGLGSGARPIELARANAPGVRDGNAKDLTNSYPRWSPFEFARSGEFNSRLNWISFSSRRSYGLRRPPPSSDGSGTSGLLLWMAAVEPSKVGAAEDPSHPAFALPFQDLGTSNHLAQWTTRVVPIVQ